MIVSILSQLLGELALGLVPFHMELIWTDDLPIRLKF